METFVAGGDTGVGARGQWLQRDQCHPKYLSGFIFPARSYSERESSRPISRQDSRRKSFQSDSTSKLAYAISTGADGENRPAHRETQTAAYAQIRFGLAGRSGGYL